MDLRNQAYTLLSKLQSELHGLVLVSPPPGPLASPIITVGLPENVTSAAVANAMAENYNTVVKVQYWSFVLFSLHPSKTICQIIAGYWSSSIFRGRRANNASSGDSLHISLV